MKVLKGIRIVLILCVVSGWFMIAKETKYFSSWTTNYRHGETRSTIDTLHRGQLSSPSVSPEPTRSVEKGDLSLRRDGYRSSNCFYRDFQHPDVHSGLPMVGEVFASYDRKWVYLIAEIRAACQKKYEKAHDFFSYWTNASLPNIRYNCIFEPDGSRVLSDSVFQTSRTRQRAVILVVRCPVPKSLRRLLPSSGAVNTTAHLTLESTVDLITGETLSITEAPKLSHLPICSHAWPSEDGDKIRLAPQKQRRISIMTRLAVSYERGTAHEPLSVTHREFVEWMEYHLDIGIEHFYIYDDSSDPHNSTVREWCSPYVAQGLVTHVHYPKEDAPCDQKEIKGGVFYSGQYVSTNAALRRYENETEWLGHWDVDEFLFIRDVAKGTMSLLRFLDVYGKNKDEIGFQRLVYGICAGGEESKGNNVLGLERKRCYIKQRSRKGIYRTRNVLAFSIHSGTMRLNQTQGAVGPINVTIVQSDNGYVGHFRKGKAAGTNFPIHSSDFNRMALKIKDRVAKQLDELSPRFPQSVGG